MEKNNFIYFKSVVKILEKNDFFGLTAKREKNNRILYTYVSVKYPNITIKVLTMRLNEKEILNDKIILGIKINDKEIKGWNDFIKATDKKELYKLNKYGSDKKN